MPDIHVIRATITLYTPPSNRQRDHCESRKPTPDPTDPGEGAFEVVAFEVLSLSVDFGTTVVVTDVLAVDAFNSPVAFAVFVIPEENETARFSRSPPPPPPPSRRTPPPPPPPLPLFK
jgi:hypothetical protein